MFAIPNPKLAPYRVKILALKVSESLVIPWHEFESKVTKKRERPISNGEKTWLITARDYGLEVKRIE